MLPADDSRWDQWWRRCHCILGMHQLTSLRQTLRGSRVWCARKGGNGHQGRRLIRSGRLDLPSFAAVNGYVIILPPPLPAFCHVIPGSPLSTMPSRGFARPSKIPAIAVQPGATARWPSTRRMNFSILNTILTHLVDTHVTPLLLSHPHHGLQITSPKSAPIADRRRAIDICRSTLAARIARSGKGQAEKEQKGECRQARQQSQVIQRQRAGR